MDTNRKTFQTPNGTAVAAAVVPDDFEIQAMLDQSWQSETVPFTARIKASGRDGIILISDSKQIYHDVRNMVVKGLLAFVPMMVKNSYQSFVDPETYLKQQAEEMFGYPLEITAKAELPSLMGMNPDSALSLLQNEVERFSVLMELPCQIKDRLCESVLYRMEGKLANGKDAVVLAGMDYLGAEISYGGLYGGLNFDNKYLNATKEKLGSLINKTAGADLSQIGSSFSDMLKGKEKLTMDDLMHGGLIGKAMRKKKEDPAPEPVPQVKEEPVKEESAGFGHRKADQVTFGSYRRYYCVCLKENEAEATPLFLNFVRSIETDPSLLQAEGNAVNQKITQSRQIAAQSQNLAMQKQMQLQQMQRKTSQMIADNARHASDGLMDSWNKKMASDSRISQARSEAIRGVDVYQNSYGQNVDVSVSADHVYQNQYGDVYGVSGNAPDQETLNSLNWTELKKK